MDGDFDIEITMYEEGVPPEFRVYARRRGQSVEPTQVQLTMALTRLGGRVDRIAFRPEQGYLRSTQSIDEPHSYAVTVDVVESDRRHTWKYESFEGRTMIPAEMARGAGIDTAVAGPGKIAEGVILYGSIQPDVDRVRAVSARFPGLIRTVRVQVGDPVRQGQVLATVESNESLQTYSVTAPIGGVITERKANPGETTGGDHLFEVADFSRVRADLNVFPRDRSRLRPGQLVLIKAADGTQSAEGRVVYVVPSGEAGNQALIAQVLLDNQQGRWTPGQFIEGRVTVAATDVPLVVPGAAVQTFRDWQVVFVNVGDDYEVRPLRLGRSDGELVEVLAGIEPGDRYVSANSYVVKADIEKSGASHDH
jgi:cobalt-zinc-cadmium efflux system membrane fusion protein